MLKLYNYLARKKEIFKPIRGMRAGLYTCGPTVYNYAHIGNLRTYIFEDILRRALEFSGYEVKHVMNLTDVDDKTIRGAAKARKSLKAFTAFFAKEFFKDAEKLNILPAWKYPRATGHIKEMVRLIEALLKKNLAYRADDGVYFAIRRFRPYGKLSRIKARALKTGARVASDEYSKTEARDFALWKAAKPDEPSWPAPFGRGRPGWHIECSAMSMKHLGKTFDIHAGGIDLLFPHHEDEIAQSEGATGKPFARYFVEGEHLMVEGKKMSKSLGNIFTLRDIESRGFEPMDFRWFVLGAHYRTPLNFIWKALGAAKNARGKIIASIEKLQTHRDSSPLREENELLKVISYLEKQFREAVEDDLNTPKAVAALGELIHYANELAAKYRLSTRGAHIILATIKEFDRVLGLNLLKKRRITLPGKIRALADKREELRQAKQWQEADRIRKQLEKLGYAIEDTPRGPSLKKFRAAAPARI